MSCTKGACTLQAICLQSERACCKTSIYSKSQVVPICKNTDQACGSHLRWLLLPCRVIASQASVPLVYVPLEAVASKWYGESERLLSDVFKAAEVLPGCIIFLDEVDSLATSRCVLNML